MKKYTTHREMMASLDPARRARIEERTKNALIAIRLAELRKDANLSQKELADKIGVSQSAISQLENSDNVIQLDTLTKYVNALGGKLHLSVELPSGQAVQLS
ncbi:helix-turn-helix domain-containing protein [Moraxella nasicaprae]|uniref:Helix-turn-helix transcriptional regulator n=1 Tax=Moraxella nasicaprae TaxID=2904122 RepID=A0ABY6F380_9GAMM|nr:helix-turn-helix transcriptional regulator [Moraxella nasicaprae]UXZ04555.1 helix-turn-helix transcriptional regulator [Moraxella nasicaprae]